MFALIAVTLQALDLIHAANPVAMVLSVLVLLAVAMRVSLSFRSLRESEQLRVALLDAEEQRRMVLNQMLSAEADERARIAEELHDDTVQVLTATLLSLDRQRLSGERGAYEAAAEAGQRARDTLALALERTRRLMFELRPPLLEAHGLAPAVRDLVEHANHELGLEVEVQRGRAPLRRGVRDARLPDRARGGGERAPPRPRPPARGDARSTPTASCAARSPTTGAGSTSTARSTATAPACTWASTRRSSGSGSPAARSTSTRPRRGHPARVPAPGRRGRGRDGASVGARITGA